MSNRVYYLRDRKNIRQRTDGTFTRGNPVAIVMTRVDRAANKIYYSIAAVHSKDCFVKATAKKIASGRLDKSPMVIDNAPATGHLITMAVMKHIVETPDPDKNVSRKTRDAAKNWLRRAASARLNADTMPAPPSVDMEMPIIPVSSVVPQISV